MNLKTETLEKIDKLIPRYPRKRSAVLPLCHLVQEDVGYVSKEAIDWIAGRLEIEPMHVWEVVTFYPMLREQPIGRRHIKVCRTLSCALGGAYEVKKILHEALVESGEEAVRLKDYTIEFSECLASCGTAPVLQVDEALHENVTPDAARKLAEEIMEETRRMKNREAEGGSPEAGPTA